MLTWKGRSINKKRKTTKLDHKANNDLIVGFQALGHIIYSGMFIHSFLRSFISLTERSPCTSPRTLGIE